jgi:hypothetical protein
MNGYFPYEVHGSSLTILPHHPSVRMMSVIENEKKNFEESGDLSWDQVTYSTVVPYSRSRLIKGYERILNDQTMKRANYIRMESSE